MQENPKQTKSVKLIPKEEVKLEEPPKPKTDELKRIIKEAEEILIKIRKLEDEAFNSKLYKLNARISTLEEKFSSKYRNMDNIKIFTVNAINNFAEMLEKRLNIRLGRYKI